MPEPMVIITYEQLIEERENCILRTYELLKADEREPVYYTPQQLADKFPYRPSRITAWIKSGQVGRIDITGKPVATYEQMKTFLRL